MLDGQDYISALHSQFSEKLVQYAFRKTGDMHMAEDMVQETFLTAVFKWETLSQHPNPGGWLFKTLQFIIMREMSLTYHAAEVSFEESEFYLEAKQITSLTEILPASLSPAERELLTLRFERQWSCDDIAEYKGISNAACRKQLSRAIRHCREKIKK